MDLLNAKGELQNDIKSISEILREQYEKVFNTKKADVEITINEDRDENETFIGDYFKDDDHAPFSEITISENDIRKAIEETKINSASGV